MQGLHEAKAGPEARITPKSQFRFLPVITKGAKRKDGIEAG